MGSARLCHFVFKISSRKLMRRRKTEHKKGFTFIEILVTLVVLSLGALAVLRYVSETQDLLSQSKHIDTLSKLANQKIIEFEDEGFSSSTVREGYFDEPSGYKWTLKTKTLDEIGWYKAILTVKRLDNDRKIRIETIFQEN